jgi:hypothetical protein
MIGLLLMIRVDGHAVIGGRHVRAGVVMSTPARRN